MSSKSRGGLSKREYAAKQKGGTLSYKTGKISIPTKTKVKTQTYKSATSEDPTLKDMGYLATDEYNTAYKNGTITDDTFAKKSKDYNDNKKSSGRKTISVPFTGTASQGDAYKTPSQRSQAANAYNATGEIKASPTGIKGIVGKGVSAARNWLGDLMGNYGQMIGENGLSQSNAKTQEEIERNRRYLAENTLGISGANASVADLGDVLNKPVALDQPTGYGPNGEQYFNDYDPAKDGGSIFQSDFGKGYSRPGSEVASRQGISPISYGNTQRKSQESAGSSRISALPVSPQIYSPNPVSGGISGTNVLSQGNVLSDAYNKLISLGYNPTENTPIASENGTVNRLPGRGHFASGQYGNGSGDYGLQGGFAGGNAMNTEDNLLNQLLGIPTANAQVAENYDMSYNQGLYNTTSPVPGLSDPNQIEYINGIPYWKGDNSDTKLSSLSNQEDQLKSQLDPNELAMIDSYLQTGDTSGFGNVLGASSQRGLANAGITGLSQPKSTPTYDDGSKYYKKQEKAQEKAWKELKKSIESQYSQDVSKGTSELEKAKQEDLLKLSGLFSFANSDPNDEQRIQYQNRATNDWTGKLNELLTSLASQKNQNLSSGKQNYQSSLAQIAQARAEQQAKTEQLIQQQQQQQYNNRLALLKLMGYGDNNQKQIAQYAPDGSYTLGETDPITGKKIFYDESGQAFYHS
jgi:hypothetical protein